MKKIGIIAFAIVSQAFFGQTVRFVYRATTMPDSTDLKSVKSELANLDMKGSKSIFYGESKLKRDSIMQRARQTQNFNLDRSQMENLRSNINYTVEKDLANQSVTYKDRVGRDQYSYTEKSPMEWKITPETMKIGDYKVQKATTNYGGRAWEAWFTTDLPYQDGPYKFSGLPGLIVKAQDKKNEYSFDLVQVKKIDELPTFESRGQNITITRDKFRMLQEKFRADPEAYMQAERNAVGNPGGNFGGPGRGTRGGGFRGGNMPDPAQRQQMRERMLQNIKNNNNPIELK